MNASATHRPREIQREIVLIVEIRYFNMLLFTYPVFNALSFILVLTLTDEIKVYNSSEINTLKP